MNFSCGADSVCQAEAILLLVRWFFRVFAAFSALALLSLSAQADQAVDATDPTKIYSYVGAGMKYSEYTNGEYMWELRATGNIGLSESDMILFEGGYGKHRGDQADGKSTGLTRLRFRWFHLFNMDYDLARGYRGWGTSVDLQLAGNLKGQDGQNVIIVGAMPAFALGGDWNLYLQLNVANTWDKTFENWNGIGPGAVAQFIYSPDNWWPGAQVRIIPGYIYWVAGELEGDGSGELEVNVGGNISPTVTWDVTAHKNFDTDLKSLRREPSNNLENDWNVFFNVAVYF
jgi:hypothetical protein